MWVIPIVVIVLFIAGALAFLQQSAFLQAKQRYQSALGALTQDPENISKRTAALAAGREYAQLVRGRHGQKRIGIFDETALQNDLAARIGKSTAPPAAVAGSAPDKTGQLLKLAELHEKGLLSKDEFDREKQRLLEG